MFAKFLAAYYRDIRVFKLPAEEFVRFGQTVLFANRKQNVQRDDAEMNRLIEMATSRNAPCLSETTDSIEIHPSTLPDAKFFLRKVTLYPTEVYGVVELHGAHGTQQWRDLLDTFHDGAFQPVVPLRVGHVGLADLVGSDGHGVAERQTGQRSLCKGNGVARRQR